VQPASWIKTEISEIAMNCQLFRNY